MDFSDHWRSLWPVSSILAAPNLLSAAASKPIGPLLFRPSSSSPPIPPLLSSPSLALRFPPPLPPSTLLDAVRTFFRSPDNAAFLPSAAQYSLASDLLPSSPDPPANPIPSNNLHALRCRDGSTLALFFPAGDNAHSIGFLTLSFASSPLSVTLDHKGDIFRQNEGFKHPYHRITKMSVSPAPTASDLELSGNASTEGFLLAVTLYSVNWFRIETRNSISDRPRPFLVPVAKQGFNSSVVHACWSPHFQEESAALLENGDLCWFNLNTKSGGTVRVNLGGDDPGEWLSCEFGGQPWIVVVASSTAVGLVDLRSEAGSEANLMARIDMLVSYRNATQLVRNDRFLAFCKAGYCDFYVAVASEYQLFLFDTRQPLVPVLTWDHGLDRPSYVAMFKLSELRPSSDEFKWASDSGFAILVGSFWNDEFNLFCYGPKERGAANDSLLYAWELPSCLPLSGRWHGSADSLIKERFSREDYPDVIQGQHKKNVVVGFYVVPSGLSTLKLESAGFSLIRLMLSGKLEMQSYHASWESYNDISNVKDEDLVELKDFPTCSMNKKSSESANFRFFKLQHLYEYMNGGLSNSLALHTPQPNSQKIDPNSFSRDLIELSKKLKSSSSSISSFISDASIPTSILEIASRKVLAGLRLDLLLLSFSKCSDLSRWGEDFSFEFLEVPSSLPHHNLPPFFVVKPSWRRETWTKKAPEENLVGPVLPLPVLLALQEMDMDQDLLNKGLNDGLLTHHCKMILENVFPETSIADSASGWDASQEAVEEKPFFVYEPTQFSYRSRCNLKGGIANNAVKEEPSPVDPLKQASLDADAAIDDKRLTTFICGIAEKTSCPDSGKEPGNLEMLNLSPIRLDFDTVAMDFQTQEKKAYRRLKRQFATWQDSYKPYEDFCSSFKIPKLPP